MAAPWVFLLSLPWVYGDTWISQDQLSFTRKPNKTVHISCKLSGVPLQNTIVHWYQLKEGEPLKRIFYGSSKTYKQDKPHSRLETDEKNDGTFYLIINNVITSDEATYYCACWDSTGWNKVFAEGTKLIVIPSDKHSYSDSSPKPTIFLPSVAETNLHKAGTYLCLLEKFFPDIIRVYWKEKDDDKILDSQEGETMKVDDTYMKFSWLTVSEKSMHREHRCIVKHENNKRGIDQEILFPPIKKVAMSSKPTTCWEDKNDALQLHFTSTTACYIYLLLVLKSGVYLAIVSFSLLRRTAVCGNKKSA